jgi:transcriptional regulator with XRE-family HTH domain
MSDKKTITPEQCRGARAMLGWSQEELAAAATVARATVADFERGTRSPVPNNLGAIHSAFEKAGIRFIPDQNGAGVGVRLRQKTKNRASE